MEDNCPICSYIEQEKKVLSILSMNENGNIQKIMKSWIPFPPAYSPFIVLVQLKNDPIFQKNTKRMEEMIHAHVDQELSTRSAAGGCNDYCKASGS